MYSSHYIINRTIEATCWNGTYACKDSHISYTEFFKEHFTGICWFRPYLTGRLQVTDVDGTMSVTKGITFGVPFIISVIIYKL